MYRKKIEQLKKWRNNKHRKPLALKGARQVGKNNQIGWL
jgi:predicted AAA+ superfamily ATPase